MNARPASGDARGGRVATISAILVSWGDADDLEAAVASLALARQAMARSDLAVRLVVVGNGGGADSVRPDRILRIWPDANMIVNAENIGLGPAANQAAAAAAGDVFLFLNPDTRAEGDPFSALAEGFDARQEAVALAPRLLDGSPAPEEEGADRGSRRLAPPGAEDQFTFQVRMLPRLSADARELLLWDHLSPNGGARRRFRYAGEDRSRPFPVEQAAAAALAVRASAFARIGGFDEAFVPAWFEDVDLCARLLPLGQILYWPAARFRHTGGSSAKRLGYDRFLPILYANALRYRRRHYSLASRAAYRALLAAGMALRLAVLPLRRGVPRPASESARAYLAVMRRAIGLSRGAP